MKQLAYVGQDVRSVANDMNEALIAHYCCTQSLVSLVLAGELRREPGYFSFGESTICFGRSSVGPLAKAPGNGLPDLSRHVISDGSTLQLPFNPSEATDNLRRERYAANTHTGFRTFLSSKTIQSLYYSFRPLMPIGIRKHLQRLHIGSWGELPFPTWPIDTTVERVLERLLILVVQAQGIKTIPFVWFWPEGYSSCAVITHDVETRAGALSVPRLMDLDEAFGIRSSFQLIPQKQYPVEQHLLEGIRTRGFEVCVHDLTHDGNLFDDRKKFSARARAINRYLEEYGAHGFRAGRLYRNTDWLDDLDISYDMSVPNVGHLEAQRGGCCTVFPYFINRILELPLTTTQDYSLLHVLRDYSTDLWKRQLALIMEKHGMASFIIHPDYIMEKRALGVYKDLLKHISHLRDERHVWVALPRDVNRWWRERSQMRLVPEGREWGIQGAGNGRARIAYASLNQGRLVYTVFGNAGRQALTSCEGLQGT